MKSNENHVKSLVFAGLFAALIYVATTIIQLRTPTGGYVNLGDCFILLGAWLLGPIYGFGAAGVGSALCDLLGGYTAFVPGTFVIKGLMAPIAVIIYLVVRKVLPQRKEIAYVCAGVVVELWMTLGYFLYEAIFLGYGLGAAASIPGNLVQGLFGVVAGTILSVVLLPLLAKQGLYKAFVFEKDKK